MYVGFTNRELTVCYFNVLITDKRLIRNKGKHSSIAQSVEQRTVNPWVVGSSPTWGAKTKIRSRKRADFRLVLFINIERITVNAF